MSETSNDRGATDRDERATARLVNLAGPRPPIPDDIEKRVYQRVREEWQAASTVPDGEKTYRNVKRAWRKNARRERRFQWAVPVALAASIAIAAVIVLQPTPTAQRSVPVGTVVKVIGAVSQDQLPAMGQDVYPGDTISTAKNEGISLLFANADSMRMAGNSTLLVKSKTEFELVRGQVYVDSGDRVYRDKSLSIETAFGKVTDIGTQFIVVTGADSLEVAVREGRVNVSNDGQQLVAVAGELLQVLGSGEAETSQLQPHSDYWSWATDLAPTFDIENRSLHDFLRWAARETGRELVFETSELRLAAMRTDLHGSVSGFSPTEAIDSVMSTTRFRFRIEPGRIVIIG